MEKEFLDLIREKTIKEHCRNVKDDWGLKRGTKEAEITGVRLLNRWGLSGGRFKTGDSLKIEAAFKVKNKIIKPHFGIAIFRDDHVYCYGPNTMLDGVNIESLNPGRGKFFIRYQELLLSPGEYYISVAIWDPSESRPYDYHCSYYKLEIVGKEEQVLYKEHYTCSDNVLDKEKRANGSEKRGILLTLINRYGDEKKEFKTNSGMKLILENIGPAYLKAGDDIRIYREDGILCFKIKGLYKKRTPGKDALKIEIPVLHLLPGMYAIHIGDRKIREFSVYSEIKDHGMVYMPHRWDIMIP